MPLEVVTDKSPVLASVIADLVPEAEHCTDQYANNRIECDHGRLKARLRPMRGLKTDRTASVVIRGHAFVQNIRRGHYQLDYETDPTSRLEAAFTELLATI
jgi:transposase-like protein